MRTGNKKETDCMPVLKMSELKAKERETRRQLILAAARTLFAEKSYRSVTVREIARKAGISTGTLYNYYTNLDELFLDVFFAGTDEIIQLLADKFQHTPFPIHRFCEIYIDYLNTHMIFYQLMGHFMLGGSLSKVAVDRLNATMRTLMDRIEKVVAASDRPANPRLTAHALFSALNGIMISYARYPDRSSAEIKRHTLRLAGLIADRFEARSRPFNHGGGRR